MTLACTLNRLLCLYFIAFLLIAFYFGSNLILATIYTNYKRQANEKAREYAEKTEDALNVAFHLLDIKGENQIDIPLCVLLLMELERPAFSVFAYETSRLEIQNTKEMVQGLQDAIDEDGLTGVSMDHFSRMVSSMQLNRSKKKWGKTRDRVADTINAAGADAGALDGTPFLPALGGIDAHGSGIQEVAERRLEYYWMVPIERVVRHVAFEYVVDLTVITNTVVLGLSADQVARCYRDMRVAASPRISDASASDGGYEDLCRDSSFDQVCRRQDRRVKAHTGSYRTISRLSSSSEV
jgi:hypothetical protein